ncbi:MAG: ABC transporter ATP-binding protein [Acidimicrobiaceae bacterium]|nr:ABC transporter ATP-binding protein [Acidimicrobiaceae bacterium]
MTGDTPLLKTEEVSVRFGGVRAVDSVSLEIHRGVVTGIIGPNGAGKSSFIDAVSGRILPTSGRVWFDGTDVTRWPLYRRARAGLVRTFQTTSEFSGLTVFENLIAAAVGPQGAGFGRAVRGGKPVEQANQLAWNRAWEVLERFEMTHAANLLGAELSGGQRRLLEIMRCLVRSPKLILLDEPMVGIAQHLVAKLIEELRQVAAEGVGIVVIEHALEVIGALTDRVVVMAAGGVLADDRYENVVEDRRVQLAYLD